VSDAPCASGTRAAVQGPHCFIPSARRRTRGRGPASTLLTEADWEAIDRAFKADSDPLAGSRDTRNFDTLFERFVELAPPPIGLGSEAPPR